MSMAVSGTQSAHAEWTQRLHVVRLSTPPSTGHSAHAGARLGPAQKHHKEYLRQKNTHATHGSRRGHCTTYN